MYMGKVFFSSGEIVVNGSRDAGVSNDNHDNLEAIFEKRHAFKAFFRGLLKKYLAETVAGQEVPYVFPMCCMRWQPHSGQMQISTFQTAFSNSAMESPVYLTWKR